MLLRRANALGADHKRLMELTALRMVMRHCAPFSLCFASKDPEEEEDAG